MNANEFLSWVESNYPVETHMCARIYVREKGVTTVAHPLKLIEIIEDVLYAPDAQSYEAAQRARICAITGSTFGAPRWSREFSLERSLQIMPGP